MQDLFSQLQDPQMIAELSRKAGISEDDIRKVAALGVPTLIEAFNRNAADEQGAASLAQALDDHKDDNVTDAVGFLDRFLGGEGSRMVEHIFPGNSQNVEEGLAQKTGLQSSMIRKILSVLAPLILANMASKWSKGQKEKAQQQEYERQQQEYQRRQPSEPTYRQETKPNSPFDSPFGQPNTNDGPDLPGNRRITMPGQTRPQYQQEDVRDITRRMQEEARQTTDGSIFDMAKDILGGGQGSGGFLDDLLGGFFGKR